MIRPPPFLRYFRLNLFYFCVCAATVVKGAPSRMQQILSWLKGCGRSALTSASCQLNRLLLNDLYTDLLT